MEEQPYSNAREDMPDELKGPIPYQKGLPIRKAVIPRSSDDAVADTTAPAGVVSRVRFGVPTDVNGLVVGRWKTDYFECLDPWPNGFLSCFFPNISLAQVTARMGFAPFWIIFIIYSILLSGIYACIALMYVTGESYELWSSTNSNENTGTVQAYQYLSYDFNTNYLALSLVPYVLTVLLVVYYRIRVRNALSINDPITFDFILTCMCLPCSLAQLATQTDSYSQKRCPIGPLPTLPGYNTSTHNNISSSTQPDAVVAETPTMFEASV